MWNGVQGLRTLDKMGSLHSCSTLLECGFRTLGVGETLLWPCAWQVSSLARADLGGLPTKVPVTEVHRQRCGVGKRVHLV